MRPTQTSNLEIGTGLGLAIARQFTQAHGGRLHAESSAGGSGATFILSLPLRGQ